MRANFVYSKNHRSEPSTVFESYFLITFLLIEYDVISKRRRFTMKRMKKSPIKTAKAYTKQRIDVIKPLAENDAAAMFLSLHEMNLDNMMMTIMLDQIQVDPKETAKKLVPYFMKNLKKGTRFGYLHDMEIEGILLPEDYKVVFLQLLEMATEETLKRKGVHLFAYPKEETHATLFEQAGFTVLLEANSEVPALYVKKL